MRKRRWEQRWWDFRVPLYHPFRDVSPEYQVAQASNYAMAHPIFTLRIRLPRLHHQPAVLLDAPAHFLRLSSDQQISRFASRGKLVLKAWEATSLAKIPLEKVVAEPAREGALDQQLPKREVCNRQEVDIIYHKKNNIYNIYI